MKLSKDSSEFIELLNSAKVKYVLVGGHAVAFHGYPRFTGDMDIFIERSPENAVRMAEVLRQFGFAGLGLAAEDFLEPSVVVQLGRPPNRIDILTAIDGVEFDEAWATKVGAKLERVSVFLLNKELLIRNKRATGRPQDVADVSKLSPEQ